MKFDRSILAHEQREAFFLKHKDKDMFYAECLVWCLTEGKVHGACIKWSDLGPDAVMNGPHKGKVWWPVDYANLSMYM